MEIKASYARVGVDWRGVTMQAFLLGTGQIATCIILDVSCQAQTSPQIGLELLRNSVLSHCVLIF